MTAIQIREMTPSDEYFVGSCSHVNENPETDEAAARRLAWLRREIGEGLRVKVALLDGRHAGFAYLFPGERCPWGPRAAGQTVMPCLWILPGMQKRGLGSALLDECLEETRLRGGKALVTTAYEWEGDFWFMRADWFQARGFEEAGRRGSCVILRKVFDEDAEAPEWLGFPFEFEPVPGKVVVDLFHNSFCLTSNIEAQRLREVAAEFDDRVLLREHGADEPEAAALLPCSRGIFIQGQETGWGYEAPRQGLREAIQAALAAQQK